MRYDLVLPRRIVFGWGRRSELGELARGIGRRAFLVIGSRTLERSGVIDALREQVVRQGVETVHLAIISREPAVADVDATVERLVDAGVRDGDLVIAVGGGAAIDLAKAAAALATNRHGRSISDFLEGVGSGLTLTNRPLPLIALPTTAGTGSEATRNAVISSDDPPFKTSLRAEGMVPEAVIVDPELTVSAPPSVTAHSGMDAITQLIESYVSRRSQPVTRALCVEGLQQGLLSLVRAVRDAACRPAREGMAHAALLSGIALANSGLGIAHGVAAALGVHCRVAHGLACAVMLPAALRTNRDAALADLARLSRAVLGRSDTSDASAADALIDHVTHLCGVVGIPSRLRDLGVSREQLPALVRDSRGSSMSGNPRDLTGDELTGVLEAML
jgi:alcohol dehydrogenase class IV